MKIAVVGSRTFDDYNLLKETLDKFYPKVTLIVSGGAKGADSLAERYAKGEGIPTLIFKPDWKKHGKSAGFVRNKDIVSAADTVIAFWDGESKGTNNSIDQAIQLGKKVMIIRFTPNL